MQIGHKRRHSSRDAVSETLQLLLRDDMCIPLLFMRCYSLRLAVINLSWLESPFGPTGPTLTINYISDAVSPGRVASCPPFFTCIAPIVRQIAMQCPILRQRVVGIFRHQKHLAA